MSVPTAINRLAGRTRCSSWRAGSLVPVSFAPISRSFSSRSRSSLRPDALQQRRCDGLRCEITQQRSVKAPPDEERCTWPSGPGDHDVWDPNSPVPCEEHLVRLVLDLLDPREEQRRARVLVRDEAPYLRNELRVRLVAPDHLDREAALVVAGVPEPRDDVEVLPPAARVGPEAADRSRRTQWDPPGQRQVAGEAPTRIEQRSRGDECDRPERAEPVQRLEERLQPAREAVEEIED